MAINLAQLIKEIKTTACKHSPEILTGIGIAGMLTTTIMAVRATPKAINLICEYTEFDDNGSVKELTNVTRVKLCWKCYIPAAVTCGLSICCLIGASSVNARRNTALAAAYTLSESALKEYREKVIETIGSGKDKSVMDAIAKDKLEKDPVGNREIILTEKGNTLCYDIISGRYFKSDIDKIKKAVNDVNRNLLADTYVSLNDFYYEIGLASTKTGDDIGWNVNKGLIDISFTSRIAEDDTPCLVINYLVEPRYEYYN